MSESANNHTQEKPEVVQGRLGWEPGDISQADPENLSPHPKNERIYGDSEDPGEAFVESVREKGVLEPLVVTDGKRIISGHRRWQAALKAGEDSVPVRYTDFDNDLAEREALIEFNRQREKTEAQLVREFEEALAIERERANERKKEATGHKEKFPEGESGQARDKAAEKVDADVSGRTLEKGLEVKERADEGDDTARDQWEQLERGEQSLSGAYSAVKEAGQDHTENTDINPFTSQDTDEWSSPREIVEPIDDAVGGFKTRLPEVETNGDARRST